ncbi:hypothetical protein BGZ99_004402 [Dissophora globulifera]|uniref:Uncharacterized protein n=1 Tax=Dissophora globulifera TaxID=979702 RepID=A0A9P6RKF1_9FUNG|nr:hypothetical protein BGZ99_004402 [Dissophora globulifera]
MKHCRHDLVQLRTFLFVSRSFYLTALPYLYLGALPYFLHDPDYDWNSQLGPFFDLDREKLVTVILASFFEARVLKRRKRGLSLLGQESARDNGRDAKLVDAALRPFGLRVTEDAVKIPSMRRFLMPATATESTSQTQKQSAANASVMDDIAEDSDEIEGTQPENDAEGEIEEYDLGSWGYPMTVDYSRYLTTLSGYDWKTGEILLRTVLRLRRIPTETDDVWSYLPDNINDIMAAEVDNGQVPSDSNDETIVDGTPRVMIAVSSSVDPAEEGGDDDGDDDHEHSLQDQLEDSYQWHLAHAVESMLLHYNFDCITSFTFHMVKAASYLTLAPKMAKLQCLRLHREMFVPDIHINNTALFIRRNQAAFPRKPRLNLEFLFEMRMTDDEGDDLDDGENPHYLYELDISVVEELQLPRSQELREYFIDFMKLKITLYEAVGRPRAIKVGRTPLFYEHSQGIDVDGLLAFDDRVMDRIEHGEGPAMEAFFRRCKSLRELKIRVDSHTLFSLAAAEAMRVTGSDPNTLGILSPRPGAATISSTGFTSRIHGEQHQSSSTGILKHLQTLKLYTPHPYRFAIHALNDAMVAFAGSLQDVTLRYPSPSLYPWFIEEDSLYRNPAIMRRARRSLRLKSVPWANTIGDWPRPLPQLQTLTIFLSYVASVDIGSLDQCHNLRKLEIHYGYVKQDELRPGDISVDINTDQEEAELPSDAESARQLMNERYQQADLNFALFPKWNLPRLRVLVLGGLPALRFDFESLETMPGLVELRLIVTKTMTDLQTVHDHQSLHNTAWEQKRVQDRNTIFKRWNLPALKTVTIDGVPATMFYLDWLRSCPSLENLTLGFPGKRRYLQRRPFFLESGTGQKGSSHTENDHGHDDGSKKDRSIGEDGANENGNGDDQDNNTPFWSSQLIKLELRGPWIISEEDLIALLTIYAPFLESFHVDRLTENESLSGYDFLQAFRRADEIYTEYAAARRQLLQAETCSEAVGGRSDSGKDTRVPGQALTSVQAKYMISKHERQALGLALIEPEEAVVFRSRRVRVYKMMEKFLVRRADRECFDLEMGERVRTRSD